MDRFGFKKKTKRKRESRGEDSPTQEPDVSKPPKQECLSKPRDLKLKVISAENLNCDHVQLYSKEEADKLIKKCEPRAEDSPTQEQGVSKPPKQECLSKPRDLKLKVISAENLNCDYMQLYSKEEADKLFNECEKTLKYNTGHLARVYVFGKWHDIPRKQVAHGDPGLAYSFSGNTIPARPWTPLLLNIRDHITTVTGYSFNFVLINRYKDGGDHMREHRDDEDDLERGYPIASLSLGAPRDFVFKHADTRGKYATRYVDHVKIELEHGSLLMMKHPTNTFWYHCLPVRRNTCQNVRINMTFRKMITRIKRF